MAGDAQAPDGADDLPEVDPDEALAELERRSARSTLGIRAPVALAGLAVVGLLAWQGRADVAYFFSPREPLTLGAEGAYLLEAIQPNRYVQLHGVPTQRGLYVDESGRASVIVGLRDSPFLVKRGPLPGEERVPGRAPPRPDQRPFGVRGRLLSREDAPAYAAAFDQLRGFGEVQPVKGELFLVVEGEKPGRDVVLALAMGLLSAFAAFNAWVLTRAVRGWLRPR
ncbi:MAG: hypothetical protein RL653_1560 [Pseudomonadota bacterium]|jgi:hypothetical protein